MEITSTVKQITAQVESYRRYFALKAKNMRFQYVQWGPDSLKVSRGSQGVIIRYDKGQDLYGLTYYNGLQKSEELEGVYFEQLEELVVAKLSKKIRF